MTSGNRVLFSQRKMAGLKLIRLVSLSFEKRDFLIRGIPK